MFYIKIICIVLLYQLTLFSKEFPFNYERIDLDFNGVTSNSKSVIAYANGGIILKSTDKGNTWKHIAVAKDEYDIKKIKNFDGVYFGILDSIYIIKSTDDGGTWDLIAIDSTSQLLDYDYNSGYHYLLKPGRLDVYNDAFQVINSITLDSSANATEMIYFSNHVYIPINKGRIVDYDVSNNFSSKIIDFVALGFCTDSIKPNRLKVDGSNLYVLLKNQIMKASDLGVNWTQIAISFGYYCPYKDNIFDANIYTFIGNQLQLFFYKLLNLKFSQISESTEQRRVTKLIPSEYQFIDDTTIILFGKYQTIYLSNDGGINWKLISNGGSNSYWLDEKKGFFSTTYGQSYKTTDSGTTWLPPILTGDLTTYTLNNFGFPYISYWDPNGKGFIWYSNEHDNEINFQFTEDYGDSYRCIIRNELKNITNGWSWNFCSLLNYNNHYKLYVPNNSMNYYYTQVFSLDSNFNYLSSNKIDSVQILKVKQIDNEGNYIAVGIDRRKQKDSSYYSILYSHDFGNSWQKDFGFNLTEYPPGELYFDNNFIQITSSSWDTLHPGYMTFYLSLVDMNKKTYLNHYYIDSMTSDNGFFSISKKLYIGGYIYGLLFINLSGNNNPIIEKFPLHGYNLSGSWSDDTLAYIAAVNRLSLTHYRLTKKPPTSVKESMITINTDNLWLSTPYPTPSQNSVKVNVRWGSDWDFGSANYGVVDLQGRKIAGKESISLIQQNQESCTLQWDCSNITQGIYFLWVSHGTSRQVVPVYVER